MYDEKFEEIERETGLNYKTAPEIIRREIDRVRSKDFYKMLTCLGDLNSLSLDTQVVNGIKFSTTIRNRILDNPALKPKEVVLEKKNINISNGKNKYIRTMINKYDTSTNIKFVVNK